MISIIVPVYNEEKTIRPLLNSFSYKGSYEVIVVDGDSHDRTAEFAKEYPVKVIKLAKGRAFQMNEGAKSAKGEKLLFLHADCLLEKNSLEVIERCLNDGYIGGCLSQAIHSGRAIYRIIEVSGNIRARLSKLFYGDQAIFVRKEVFLKIGGFDNVELFDDVIFSKKLKRAGKTCVLSKKVYSSPRRWERQGVIKTTLINWFISIGFILGVSPDRLKQLYHDIR